MNKKLHILSVLFLGISQLGFSQIKEEKLILDRKREPEVRNIQKKQTSVETVKNYPPKEKRIQDSLNLKYNITDVPAVSDFKTSTIQGQDMAPDFRNTYQDNYIRFGMGNYGKILGDATVTHMFDEKLQAGVDFHYLSTTGLKSEYPWNSKSSAWNGNVFLNHFGESGKTNVEAGYENNAYNYYGIYAFQPSSDTDLKQRYGKFHINGYYDYYSNDILDDIRFKSSFLSDHYNAKERLGALELNLEKGEWELPGVSDVSVKAGLGLNFGLQDTQFDILNAHQSNFFIFGAEPEVEFKKEDSYLKLGVKFDYLVHKYSALTENSETENKTGWFPMAELQIAPSDRFKFYAGVDGGTQLNSYSDMLKVNPFLVSDQILKPTETKYHVYAGIRGDLNEKLKYDLSGGYSKVEDALFFAHNPLFNTNVNITRAPYDYLNTMSAFYDSGNLVEFGGNLEYFPMYNLSFNAGLQYKKYNLEADENVYGSGGIAAELGTKYNLLNNKLKLGAKLLFDSGNIVDIYKLASGPQSNGIYNLNTEAVDVPAYLDINFSAEYQVHKNFSIFALGNNLMNTKYQNYYGYKVLGAQILGGVKISF